MGRPVSENSTPLEVDVVASGKVAVRSADVPVAVLSFALLVLLVLLVVAAESVSDVLPPEDVAVVCPVVASPVASEAAVVSAFVVEVAAVTVAKSGKSVCAFTIGTASSARSAIARITFDMADKKGIIRISRETWVGYSRY